MLHRTAKLTPFGRRLLVERILIEGWPPAIAAETLGVSRATAYKWLRRYRAEGLAGLEDRSARPRTRPRALAERDVRRILRVRRRLRVGPHRLGPLLGHPRSTVYGVLRRHGVSRLAHADRLVVTGEVTFDGVNAAGRLVGGFADIWLDLDGDGTGDVLACDDVFIVSNHSGQAAPGQTEAPGAPGVLPPIIRGQDPGGDGSGLGDCAAF